MPALSVSEDCPSRSNWLAPIDSAFVRVRALLAWRTMLAFEPENVAVVALLLAPSRMSELESPTCKAPRLVMLPSIASVPPLAPTVPNFQR